jgi:hypothetical protein
VTNVKGMSFDRFVDWLLPMHITSKMKPLVFNLQGDFFLTNRPRTSSNVEINISNYKWIEYFIAFIHFRSHLHIHRILISKRFNSKIIDLQFNFSCYLLL